jgi:hypothetical protein
MDIDQIYVPLCSGKLVSGVRFRPALARYRRVLNVRCERSQYCPIIQFLKMIGLGQGCQEKRILWHILASDSTTLESVFDQTVRFSGQRQR